MTGSIGPSRRPRPRRAGVGFDGRPRSYRALPRSHRERRGLERPAASVDVAPRSIALFVAFALLGVLLLSFLYLIRDILGQLLTAVVMAIALEPLVAGLQHRGLGRTPAVILTFSIFLVATVAFVVALFPSLAEGCRRLVQEAPDFLARLGQSGPLAGIEKRYHIFDSARAWLAENGARLAGPPTLRFAQGFLATGTAMATVAFLGLFILLSGGQAFSAFLDLMPAGSRPRLRRAGEGISKAVGGYVFGNLLISVIAGTVATLVLLATRVPYALPLGLVVAVFDLIPMVGAALATVIVGLVALSRGIGTSVIVMVALQVYQLIENNLLTQLVYHGTVSLSPVTIAVSIAIGAQLGGVAGTLLAIPVAGAIKVVLGEVLAWRRERSSQ